MKYDALCRAHLGQLIQSDGVDEKRTINGDTLIYLCDNQLIFIMLKPHRKWLNNIQNVVLKLLTFKRFEIQWNNNGPILEDYYYKQGGVSNESKLNIIIFLCL